MATIAKFTLVQVLAGSGGKPTYQPWTPTIYEQPGLGSGHKIAGVTATNSEFEQQVAVMMSGFLRGVTEQNGETWGVGNVLWALPGGSITNVRPGAPTPQVKVGVVFADEGSGGPFTVEVDVRVIPSLGELSGVAMEPPAEGDVFVYDEDSHTWIPRRLFLDELEDVNVPAPLDGEVLTWDESDGEWVASPATMGALDDLTDVNVPSPNDGDVLTWDESDGEWIASPGGAGGPHASSHQNGGGDEIDVTGLSGLLADGQKITVRKNGGADVGTRQRLNFIEGSNVTLTVADDAGNGEVDVTIGSGGEGGGMGIDGLTELRAPHVRNDFVPVYNAAAGANRKVQLSAIRSNRRYGTHIASVSSGANPLTVEGMGAVQTSGAHNTTSLPASGSFYGSHLRAQHSCLANAKRNASVSPYWMRGDGTVVGGIYLSVFFGVQFGTAPTGTAGCRMFIGLRDTANQIAADPSSGTGIACVGIAKDAADTGWQLMHAANGSAVTKVAVGGTFPAGDTMYELTLYCPANTASIAYELWNRSTGASVGSGTITTNLPATTALLHWFAGIQGLDAGNASILDLIQVTVEGEVS